MKLLSRAPHILLAIVCSLAWLLASAPLPAQEDGPLLGRFGAAQTDAPWQITADKIEASHDSEIIEGEGNVVLWQGDQYLKADFARYFVSTGWIYLRGNMEAKWRTDVLQAEEGEFDLKSQTGWVRHGRITVAQPHLYFEGEYIRKSEGETYSFQNAKVTACRGDAPAWAVSAQEGEINLDGRAQLYHIAFLVKDQPAFYAPFLSAPAQNKRLSGFLPPETAVSSRHGVQLNVPYYYVIDDEKDVTFYENFMAKRGLMQGLEYRHADNAQTKGMWRFDWLNDQTSINRESDETTDLNSDGLIRPNHDRWWMRSKLNTYLSDLGLEAKLDIDYVSDQNYLRDFRQGLSGFTRSRNEFLREFRRDIDEDDSLTRTSSLLIGKSEGIFGLYGRIDYTENLAYRNGNLPGDKDPTPQRFPQIEGYVYKSALPGLPVELEADNALTYYWRRFGTRAGVLDLHPRATLPLSLGPVSLIPGMGLHQTNYAVESYQNESDPEVGGSTSLSRTIPDLSASAFTEFFRVFDMNAAPPAGPETSGQSVWTKLKHSIQPRLDYGYTASAQQGRYPRFDSPIDRIQPTNELTYSLTNLLVRRRDSVTAPQMTQSGELPADAPWILSKDYLQFFDLRLEQTYDYREQERDEDRNIYPRRPFSDILAEVIIRFDERFSLVNRTFWSPYESTVTEHEHLLDYTDPGDWRAYFGLDYVDPIDEFKRHITEEYSIVRLGGQITFLPKWTAALDYRFDYEQMREIEKNIALIYNDQCYSIRLDLNQTPGDDRFEVRVDLLGLSIF